MQYRPEREIWIDVGAHLGEKTLEAAANNRDLTVYAFEPNVAVAVRHFGALDNFVVIPMAVCEQDGFARFYLNRFAAASSLQPFDAEALQTWIGGEQLRVEGEVLVPTIRLDTFLNRMSVAEVGFLKVDAQGGDFAVIASAGDRLKDIRKIVLEVATTARQLYTGARDKQTILEFMERNGFILAGVESQSYGQEENLTFVRREAQAGPQPKKEDQPI